MTIIYDERQHVELGKCENCNRKHVKGRRKEAFGMFGESRGFYFICFDCSGPEITWRHRDGRVITSPTKFDDNSLSDSKTKR